jgi:tetrathionate reductase subunit B
MRVKIRKRYAMTVDTRRCLGCHSCVLACKGENAIPASGSRAWVVTETRGVFPDLAMETYSARCNHCTNAPCVSACPTGASHYGRGGAVLVDTSRCTGCKACMAACPYDARYIHPDGYADKCSFCTHRVAAGEAPACASGCPSRAIAFGDRDDPASEVSRLLRQRRWKVLKPEGGSEPNVYFLL